MRIAYFDTVGGVSGDMTLAAFVSAGLPIDDLAGEIAKLDLPGVELEGSHLRRSGITAVRIDVTISAPQGHGRHLGDILALIDGSSLSARVKEASGKIFRVVAEAEAKIHDSTPEKIHFHEVGALDSIVDIVGAAICLEKFGIDAVYSSPVKLGSGGFVESEHGKLPIPGPAAAEILRGYPTVLTDIPYELTTPTGAAIIKAMSSGVLSAERIRVEAIGYGAGMREVPQVPNLLRIMVGELLPLQNEEELVVIETNIDDMNPEIYPYVLEELLSHGAKDAYLTPLIMKKGRPGVLLSALAARSDLDAVLHVFFTQTTTLGIRMHTVERRTLGRNQREVKTGLGSVRVKVISLDGKERLVPEYEECKRLAAEKKVPLVEVYRILERDLSAYQS
jgi:pyridinium-3,5-bisthiocarboxylic acid mononucleotide nickel chelatase